MYTVKNDVEKIHFNIGAPAELSMRMNRMRPSLSIIFLIGVGILGSILPRPKFGT